DRYRFVEIDGRIDGAGAADQHRRRAGGESGARLLRRRVARRQGEVRAARALRTVDAARAHLTSLQRPLAVFDGPGVTQAPDSAIEAIGDCRRSANANLGGPFETSRLSDALVARAHETAAGFLGAAADDVFFGANMTTLNFALSRAAARDWRAGDEIVCTRLD